MSATSPSGDGLSSDWCIATTWARATCHQLSPRSAFGQLRRHGPQGQNGPRTQCVSYQYTPNNTPNDVLCHFSPLSRAVSHCSIARAERRAGADVTLCSRYQSLISYPCTTATLQNPPPHEHMAEKALMSNALHLGPEILSVRGEKTEFPGEIYCGLWVQEYMRVEIETSKIQRADLEGEKLLSYFTPGRVCCFCVYVW